MRATAAIQPDAVTKEGSLPMITAVPQPASRDATMYFQTAARTGPTPKCIGLPAYQRAGIVKIQKEALEAAATPAGPHRSPRTNSEPVATNSITVQRNQRPRLPMERRIQLWVPSI